MTVLLAALKIVCLLVAIAYFTLAERKIMAAVQRRVGPNVVGLIGLLQPLADGLKLAGKEAVIPSQASGRIFVAAAIAVLLFALSGWAAIPFGLFDYSETCSTGALTFSVHCYDTYVGMVNPRMFSYDLHYGYPRWENTYALWRRMYMTIEYDFLYYGGYSEIDELFDRKHAAAGEHDDVLRPKSTFVPTGTGDAWFQ